MAPRSPLKKEKKKEGSDNYNKNPTPPPRIGPAVGRKLTDGVRTMVEQPDHEETQRTLKRKRGLDKDTERASSGKYYMSKKCGGAVHKARGGTFKGIF